MRAGSYSPERIGDGQAAIVVTVPVDADFFAARFHDFVDGEFYQVVGALRRGVTHGVEENDTAGAAADGGGGEALDGLRIGADGVFRYGHCGEVVLGRKIYGLFRGALELIQGPVVR